MSMCAYILCVSVVYTCTNAEVSDVLPLFGTLFYCIKRVHRLIAFGFVWHMLAGTVSACLGKVIK